MKKVIVTGAESTGKSTLAQYISHSFQVPLIEEYSRTYLTSLNRTYTVNDLTIMAEQHLENERTIMKGDSSFCICDTGLLVYKIWSEYKFGILDSYIEKEWSNYQCDLFLLPHYDIPFEEDPLRENPEERHILFQLYKDTLEYNDLPYVVIDGNMEERFEKAQKAINTLLLSET